MTLLLGLLVRMCGCWWLRAAAGGCVWLLVALRVAVHWSQRRAEAASVQQALLEGRRHGSAHSAVIPSSAGLADAKGLSYTFTSGQGRAVPAWRTGAT